MNQKIIVGIIVAVVAGGSFYAGTRYAKSSTPTRGQFANTQFAGGAGQRGGANGGFTAGQILSKDATSLTVKMQNGSTKIVLMASSTQIMKTATGSLADLVVGTNVTVMGASNSDGSVTAESVQIRPAGAQVFGRGPANQ